jgi:hypothetical protein
MQSAAADPLLRDADEVIGQVAKTLGSSVENKAKADEDRDGKLVMACQTTLASRSEFSRDIQ